MMLRLLLLALLLVVKGGVYAKEFNYGLPDEVDHRDSYDAVPDRDGSGDFTNDDEQDEEQENTREYVPPYASKGRSEIEDISPEDGNTTLIIVGAVCVVALAIVAIIAVVLFRRHLQRREQGVYSVPVEQGEKGV